MTDRQRPADPGCDWYERQGILEPDAPATLEHLRSCGRCRADSERIRQITLDIARDVEEQRAKLPPGWERQVWAEIENPTPRRSLLRWAAIGTGLAVAAGAVLVIRRRPPPPGDQPLLIAVRTERGGGEVRRGDVKPGDWLVVEARGLKPGPAEVRLYRDDLLVGSCSDRSPCQRQEEVLRARFSLPARGVYRAVVVTSSGGLPSTSGHGYGEDQRLVEKAGAQVVSAATLDVL